MAYSYIDQPFNRNIVSTSNSYFTGGNKLCGEVKDFLLAHIPDLSLESDNDPPLNTSNGTQSTLSRVIYIKIRGVRKIQLISGAHSSGYPYGLCTIRFVQDSLILGGFNLGNSAESTVHLNGLFIDGVGYFFKSWQYDFSAAYGYIISDEDECIIMANGSIFSLNNAYNYTILPTGYYNNYVNGKMIITEMMLKKLDDSNQTLRFKNKKIFRPGVSTYFSLGRFYIGEDNHKYAYIGTINMLIQIE